MKTWQSLPKGAPHYANMRDAVAKAIGPDIKIIEWTH